LALGKGSGRVEWQLLMGHLLFGAATGTGQ